MNKLAPVWMLAAACYTTRIGHQVDGQPVYSHRHFFTAAGLVELSEPSGEECSYGGMTYAESRFSITDFLIDFGLTAAGAVAGIFACKTPNNELYGACIAGLGAAGPALISTRTVSYQCSNGTYQFK